MGDSIAFRLDTLLPTPNRLMRMHYRERGRLLQDLAWQVRASILGPLPAKPLARAKITVTRHALQAPDVDALAGCTKLLLDLLQPPSKRHPCGLGVIANDTADALFLDTRFVRVRHRGDQHTQVVVEAA